MNLTDYTARKIIKKEIDSQHMQAKRTLRISLPPGYNPLISYPIIYALDGQDAFMYGRIATIVNYLILEKGMEPVIVVGIDVIKSRRTEEYSPQGKQHANFLRFIAEEVLPVVENEFQVRKERISRLLVGDSLAAAAALSIALHHRKYFQHILSLSGAFFEDSLRLIKQEENLEWMHIWMLIGKAETSVQTEKGNFNFLEMNYRFKEEILKLGAQVKFLEKEGRHIWGFWQQELPNGLLHFFG